jgi:nucleoside deoxyribosyltransferase
MPELTTRTRNGYNAYIASPFFCEKTNNQVEAIKKILDDLGYGYFSPKDSVHLKPDASPEEQKKAFDDDANAIKLVDFVIANTSGNDKYPTADAGTIWECGFSYANGKPIIYIWPDEAVPKRREMSFNLMIKKSGVAAVYDFDELRTLLEQLMEHDFDFDWVEAQPQWAGSKTVE